MKEQLHNAGELLSIAAEAGRLVLHDLMEWVGDTLDGASDVYPED